MTPCESRECHASYRHKPASVPIPAANPRDGQQNGWSDNVSTATVRRRRAAVLPLRRICWFIRHFRANAGKAPVARRLHFFSMYRFSAEEGSPNAEATIAPRQKH